MLGSLTSGWLSACPHAHSKQQAAAAVCTLQLADVKPLPHCMLTWGRVRRMTASITSSPALLLPADAAAAAPPLPAAAAAATSATTAAVRGATTAASAPSPTDATKLASAFISGCGMSQIGCWLACKAQRARPKYVSALQHMRYHQSSTCIEHRVALYV